MRSTLTRRGVTRSALTLLLASATVLSLGACKGKGKGKEDTTGPIKIGHYASMTGSEATFGQSTDNGIKLAVEERNAKGGVKGRTIALTTYDNQGKPDETVTAVTRLIDSDKVVALLGEVASSRSLAGGPVAQRKGVPMISPSSTNPDVTAIGDMVFRVCFIDEFQGTVMAQFALDTLKVRRVAILSSVSSPQSVGLAKFFRERVTQGGGTIALEQKYGDGDKDFRAQLTAVKAAGADAVFVPGYYTECALIVRQARDLGLTMPFFGGDGWEDEQLLKIGGEALNGCYYSTHFSAENTDPVVAAFTAKYKARWHGESPGAFSALGYDAVYVLADALKRAGATDGPKLRAALAATKNFPGVSGVTTIDKDRNATKSATIIALKDGKATFFKTVSP